MEYLEAMKKLTYKIQWYEKDQEWVGTCEQFKSLSHLDPSETGALQGIITVTANCIMDMIDNGEPMPWENENAESKEC